MNIIKITDKLHNNDSVESFAKELEVPVAVLLEQFINAGISKSGATEKVTSAEKATLLDYLRERFGANSLERTIIRIETPNIGRKRKESTIELKKRKVSVTCRDAASVNLKNFLIVITFDLVGAESKIYSKIKEALKRKGFKKKVTRNNGKIESLPSNLFTWNLQSSAFKDSSEVNDYIATELRKIFTNLTVKGRFFISVGQHWTWNIHSF